MKKHRLNVSRQNAFVSRMLRLIGIQAALSTACLPAFSQWEQVASTNGISASGGSFQNLVIDNSGNYYVSYYDLSVSRGSVQKYNGTSWSYAGGTAGITAGTATYSALAADQSGNIYYSNQNGYPNSGMNVRKFDGTSWTSMPDAESATVNFQSLAVSGSGTLLAAYNVGNGTVKRLVNGAWEQVGTSGFAGSTPYYLDMVAGTNNKVYVAFVVNSSVAVYENDVNAPATQAWTHVGGGTGVASATSSEQFRSSIAIDASNHLYLAYTSTTANGNKANVMKYDGTQWNQLGTANFSPNRVHYLNIAVTSSGTPYVAFSAFENAPNNKNMVMTFNGTAWSAVGGAAISAGEAKWNSVAIDTDGKPVIAYSDASLNKTVVMKFTGCLPAFQYNADGNMITRVQFNTIDNTSPFTSGTTPQYENFTNISTDVTIGQTYPLTVKAPSSTFPSDVMVFVDWNKDGEFNEPGIYVGLVGPANPANALSVSTDITIPATAVPGTVKMRIVKNSNIAALSNPSAPNTITGACDQNLRAGQTEDYSLNIIAATNTCSGDPGPVPGDLGCVTLTYGGQSVEYTTVRAGDGNIWLQQNLGSTRIASGAADTDAFGDLFQWGRWDDGHQSRTSAISTVAAAPNNPAGLNGGNPAFLNSSPEWWGTNALTDTWNAATPAEATAINGCDPCKALGNDWKLPSSEDWAAVISNESMTNILSAFESNLKLATGGTRNDDGTFNFVGQRGYYWTSTPGGMGGKLLYYSNFIVNPSAGYPRSQGGSIRCVKMAPVPDAVSIEVTTQNNIAVITTNGGTLQAEAEILPAEADQAVTWSIVNVTGTAIISATGLVTAQTNGTVWAKAVAVSNSALRDSVEITISGQFTAVQSINVMTENSVPAVITTNAGTLQAEAIIFPATADQAVTWSIVNVTGAATISATGLVTAQMNGTVWAKAVSVGNPLLKDSVEITISGQFVAAQSIDVVTQNGVAAVITTNGGTLQVQAVILPATASQLVTWSIVNGTGTTTISASGLITAQTNGTVWAKAVSVQEPSVKDSLLITISGISGAGLEESSAQLPVRLYPNPAENAVTLVWAEQQNAMQLLFTDVTGKIVLQQMVDAGALSTGLEIDLSQIQAGVYYVHLQSEQGHFVETMIKR